MDKLIKECLVNLRISTRNENVIDEIENLILSCQADMKLKGVNSEDISDPLISRAIKLYVKGYFNTSSKDSERLIRSYEMMRDSLSLSGDYRYEIN